MFSRFKKKKKKHYTDFVELLSFGTICLKTLFQQLYRYQNLQNVNKI